MLILVLAVIVIFIIVAIGVYIIGMKREQYKNKYSCLKYINENINKTYMFDFDDAVLVNNSVIIILSDKTLYGVDASKNNGITKLSFQPLGIKSIGSTLSSLYLLGDNLELKGYDYYSPFNLVSNNFLLDSVTDIGKIDNTYKLMYIRNGEKVVLSDQMMQSGITDDAEFVDTRVYDTNLQIVRV